MSKDNLINPNMSAGEIAEKFSENQIQEVLSQMPSTQTYNTIEGIIIESFREKLIEARKIHDIEEIPMEDVQLMDPIEEFFYDFPNSMDRIKHSATIPAASYSSIGVKKEGAKKHTNQDYIYITNTCVVVCDGIGSGEFSDEVAKEFAEKVSELSSEFYSFKDEREALVKVNTELYKINQYFINKKAVNPKKYAEAGSTLAAVFNISNSKKLVFTLGDSEVIKLNLFGDVESVTSSYLDTLFGFALEALGIQNPVRFSGLSFHNFVNQMRLEFPSIPYSVSIQDFFDILCSGYPKLNRLLRVLQSYLQNEAKFKKGKQLVVKGAMERVDVSDCNLKILDQKESEFLLTVTDGLADQMTYDQIGQVFLYGSIKSILKEYLDANPNLINIKGIDSIIDSDSIIDIDEKLNLSKILKKLISKVNPRTLFGKFDLVKEGDLRQVMLDGGSNELLKESVANMLDERSGLKGYKIPKKDNISIAAI
ncbi:hypothetical protein CL656_00890 [bacterium]|nr:hypothetical protein [bacterium]|tara:strand:+ start:2313 stop:3752 length:1440 start_codon:yes stop_codon:yes gene_type:complete